MRIDPETNTVAATIELDGKHRGGPGVWDGSTWVGTKSDLVRIDTDTNDATKIAPFGVESLYAGSEGLWVVEPERVSRIDHDSGERLASIKLPGAVWPAETSYGEGSLWVVDPDLQEVWRLDAEGGRVVARMPVGNLPHTLEFTDGAAWVAGPGHDRDLTAAGCSAVHRIDTATNEVVATILLGKQGSAVIKTFDGSLWSRPVPEVLARIDPATNEVEEVITDLPQSGITADIADGFGSLWVANWTDGTVWRINP
jgi:DNA-binding beta-propeller fold protein YncE